MIKTFLVPHISASKLGGSRRGHFVAIKVLQVPHRKIDDRKVSELILLLGRTESDLPYVIVPGFREPNGNDAIEEGKKVRVIRVPIEMRSELRALVGTVAEGPVDFHR